MNCIKVFLIVIMTCNFYACTDTKTAGKKSELLEEKLLKSIEKFNKAFQNGNVAVLESMITENYLHTNGNSKSIGKKDWLDYLSKRENEIKSGNLEVIDYKLDETEIEFYRNTAIVTGKVVVLNKENGRIQKSEYRITNIWVNENGIWKRAGFHDGKIK